MLPSANCADNLLIKVSSSSSSTFPFDHQNPNPSSTQDHCNPPFLFNPSPFFDEHDSPLNQIFLFPNQLIMSENQSLVADHNHQNINITDDPTVKKPAKPNNNNNIAPLKRRNLGAIPRRRTGKKDRHSKICTAQGIRDRRMRLSLQVARKFFDLQDTLGYDKASQTIEWLFNQSRMAIKELAKDRDPEVISEELSNFISDDQCEDVVSGIIEENNNYSNKNDLVKEITIVPRSPYSMPFCKPNMKELRDNARARARRRTLEKKVIKRSKSSPSGGGDDDHDLRKLGFLNSPNFGGDDQELKYSTNNIPFGGVCDSIDRQHHLGDVGTIEKLLMMGNSSSFCCPISDDQYCSSVVPGNLYNVDDSQSSTLMGFFGNWDVLNNVDRTNSIDYGVLTNQDSLAGNPNSIYSATPKYP